MIVFKVVKCIIFALKKKMVTKEDLYDILFNSVKTKTRHVYYDQTVKVAKFCRQIMTGDDQKDLVVVYKPSETQSQKEQRFRLYNSRTAYSAHKIVSTFKEVERVETVVDNIYFKDKTEERPVELINRIGSLKKDVHEKVRRLNFYDPNAWIVTEFY